MSDDAAVATSPVAIGDPIYLHWPSDHSSFVLAPDACQYLTDVLHLHPSTRNEFLRAAPRHCIVAATRTHGDAPPVLQIALELAPMREDAHSGVFRGAQPPYCTDVPLLTPENHMLQLPSMAYPTSPAQQVSGHTLVNAMRYQVAHWLAADHVTWLDQPDALAVGIEFHGMLTFSANTPCFVWSVSDACNIVDARWYDRQTSIWWTLLSELDLHDLRTPFHTQNPSPHRIEMATRNFWQEFGTYFQMYADEHDAATRYPTAYAMYNVAETPASAQFALTFGNKSQLVPPEDVRDDLAIAGPVNQPLYYFYSYAMCRKNAVQRAQTVHGGLRASSRLFLIRFAVAPPTHDTVDAMCADWELSDARRIDDDDVESAAAAPQPARIRANWFMDYDAFLMLNPYPRPHIMALKEFAHHMPMSCHQFPVPPASSYTVSPNTKMPSND